MTRVPIVARRFKKLRSFGATFAATRVKKGSLKKDLWYHLVRALPDDKHPVLCTSCVVMINCISLKIDEAGLEKVAPSEDSVISDGTLAIIAGADTSARSLSALLFFLVTHPVQLARVREEVDSVFGDGGDVLETSKYDRLIFLDACM